MIKWQRYLGMREEGRLRNHYLIGDRFQDAVCLGILAEEYRGQARPRMEALIAAGRKEACR
jgi:RimJ/RimL family protein N-acetyltransferase